MKKVTKKCLLCDKSFDALLKEHKRGNAKFCSRKCSAQHNGRRLSNDQKNPNVACAYCGERFYKNSAQKKNSKSGLFFCCREHKDLAQRIGGLKAIQPNHYGNELKSYRKLAFRNLDVKCNNCGWDNYPDVLEVHHKDCNRSNNHISNLEFLCPTCHEVHHFKTKIGKYWSGGGSNP
jgi:DNA-directed RNA polymerase subunit RPC12/RpoP